MISGCGGSFGRLGPEMQGELASLTATLNGTKTYQEKSQSRQRSGQHLASILATCEAFEIEIFQMRSPLEPWLQLQKPEDFRKKLESQRV